VGLLLARLFFLRCLSSKFISSILAGSVLSAQGPPKGNPEAAFALCIRAQMRTIIYVDGFNLYYRMLEKRPDLKWLNIKQVAENVLKPENQIIGVRYYTARVVEPLRIATQELGKIVGLLSPVTQPRSFARYPALFDILKSVILLRHSSPSRSRQRTAPL
jgi:hypothetical protein